ncbi:MAG TPA: DPP IV N-terminal domain-containing protein [Longimicrobiales bacterium]|nr:DPP IV N-terminal domain-containing protein [Longimicrobiales bacterium]
MRTLRWYPAASLALLAVTSLTASAQTVDYNRAERFLTWHTSNMISGDEVSPNWLEDGRRFWYRNRLGEGHEFIFVDPAGPARRQLFDHHRLAAALSTAADTAFVGTRLPFSSFEFVDELRSIEFDARKQRFVCDIVQYSCTVGDTLPSDAPYVESPDERWEAFVVEHDLHIRPKGGGDSIRVTQDGEEFYSYGLTYPRPNQVKDKTPRRPDVSWSPDSRRLAVSRQDERNVKHHHYLSMTTQRPVHYSYPYALPGDSIIPYPNVHLITLDVPAADQTNGEDGDDARVLPAVLSNVAVTFPERPLQSSFDGSVPDSAWSADGTKLFVTSTTRAYKEMFLTEVDANTGQHRLLARESSKTYVEMSHGSRLEPASWYVFGNGDVLWWSQRDGWAHLYILGSDGNVKRQLTSGPWMVERVVHVAEPAGQIYFVARGREPDRFRYEAYLYRINADGTGMTLLTPEEGHHDITWSPDGSVFVDQYSKIDTAPVAVLRSARDGRVMLPLENANIDRLVDEIGFEPAEVFTVKARDGVTDLHGLIYFPPDLDPEGSYPIITHIYPGPQVGSVGRSWDFRSGGDDFALAQLGFVVIQLDHMGTPWRSKAFHDNYYADFNDNGLPDHVAAIRQLAVRYPFIDLDRVGIYGHSGGGFATTDAMFRFPDFFKVGVAGAGNHDNRSYNIYWAEKYQGELVKDTVKETDNFEEEANKSHAANLKGKLLLMHGDMDDNVHPAMTIQVVDELIKANKDFDMIVAPDRAHGLNEPYFVRRRWDFFVRHLLGAEPPAGYEIIRPEG